MFSVELTTHGEIRSNDEDSHFFFHLEGNTNTTYNIVFQVPFRVNKGLDAMEKFNKLLVFDFAEYFHLLPHFKGGTTVPSY